MKTVVITGATSGFGKSMVEEFLKNGDLVYATGRDIENRKQIFAPIREEFKGRLNEINLDLTNAEQINAFVSLISNQTNGIDVLINNAGFGLFGALENTAEEQIRKQVEVCFLAPVLLTKKLLPALRTKHGRIINFSSLFGFFGFPLTSLYCSSKYALEGFSESLAHELRPHGVQVCVVEPGSYRTNFGGGIQWAEGADSIYQIQTSNYRELGNRLRSRPNHREPQVVAKEIVRLCAKKKMPFKVRFGGDCHSTWWMRRLLPERTFLSMMQSFIRAKFERGLINS